MAFAFGNHPGGGGIPDSGTLERRNSEPLLLRSVAPRSTSTSTNGRERTCLPPMGGGVEEVFAVIVPLATESTHDLRNERVKKVTLPNPTLKLS